MIFGDIVDIYLATVVVIMLSCSCHHTALIFFKNITLLIVSSIITTRYVNVHPTFSTDTAQVCDLHQGFGEHVWFTWPTLSHIDLESFKQWLLQLVHFRGLLEILTIWYRCTKHVRLEAQLGQIHILVLYDIDKTEAIICDEAWFDLEEKHCEQSCSVWLSVVFQ